MPAIIPTISPNELHGLLGNKQPLDLIDVRTPAEHRAVHLQGVRLMPLDELDAKAVRNTRPNHADGPCYILCKSGARARKAADKLAAGGVEVCVVEGGTDACVAAGLPVTRGKQAMSLERQVRIAAGSLVAVGSTLAWFVHPGFLALPAFVGCGLVFAGVTNTCGMGMLIAKMPWNR